MAAVLRLQVRVRVPVAVEDDARVGRHQVDAEAARARREQEDVDGRVGVEVVHRLHAVGRGDAAVEPPELPCPPREVVLEDVEHARHLREDEHLVVALPLELRQDAVEQLHLARRLHQHLVDRLLPRVRVDGPLEEVRVVAALAQLHEH
eukprot:scaffold55055_cov60-Phaeocystis_antarctica.AAC.1